MDRIRLLIVLGFVLMTTSVFSIDFFVAPPDTIIFDEDELLLDTARAVLQPNDVLSPIYKRENVPSRKPIPYHHLREADVMWKKKVWRILNLKEKINHPLYYPVFKEPYDNRISLLDIIVTSINNSEIGLEVYEDDDFVLPMSKAQFALSLGASRRKIEVENVLTGDYDSVWTQEAIHNEEVTRFEMKEVWFFDKQRSKLEVRIVALGPIREYTDENTMQLTHTKLPGWVSFKRLRPIFANQEVFNPKNDAERRTFGDIFNKRHFSSYIVQETNVYEDRKINSYKFGQDALLEGEKVKQFIFKVEHDLWEF